ncbi:MAG: Ig-like domain-containing protein [Ardenticatenales bacterium]
MPKTSLSTSISPAAAAVLAAIGLAALLGACRRTPTPPGTPAAEATVRAGGASSGGGKLLSPEPTPGVRMSLRDAEPAAAGAGGAPNAGPPVAAGTPLDDAAVARLLDRLPPLGANAATTATFAVHAGPKPPDVPGQTIPIAFPPPSDAPKPDAGAASSVALTVERVQPEGDVPVAAQVAVTFSRPFVDLTGNKDNDAVTPPVKLSPQPKGKWRWVGTQTLLFEPEGGHMPMATEYTAEVAAGVKASDGTVLAEGKKWTFRTPPPSVVGVTPGGNGSAIKAGDNLGYGPIDRQIVFVVVFDQAVDAAKVLPKLSMQANGDDVALGQATADEVAADDLARAASARAATGRWIAVRPAAPLPIGASIELKVDAGVPSAEGPLTSAAPLSTFYRVYDALAAVRLMCDSQLRAGSVGSPIKGGRGATDGCDPFGGWQIEFNNPLDAAAFDPTTIAVDPPVAGLVVQASGGSISLRGVTKGRTTYTVRVPAGLKDTFGQTLAGDVVATFKTGTAAPALAGPGDRIVTLDPAGPKDLVVSALNQSKLIVQLYKVRPDQLAAFNKLLDNYPPPSAKTIREALGEPVVDTTVVPKAEADTIADVPIDLAPALDGGRGHVVAVVAADTTLLSKLRPGAEDDWRNRPIIRWVQVTDMAVDAFRDGEKEIVWVTRLADGKPVAGADVRHNGVGDGKTAADGTLRLALSVDAAGTAGSDAQQPILATVGADTAFTMDNGDWYRRPSAGAELRFFTFDDRGLYRPGETVHVKGYVRRVGLGLGGDVEGLGAGGPTAVNFVLNGQWGGAQIAKGTWTVDAAGAFDGVIELPDDAPVGDANLQLEASAADGLQGNAGLSFGIAEFRRPEFTVSVAAEQAVHTIGESAVVAASADYYSGGHLPGAKVDWHATASRTNYSPPGWDGFTFGEWVPWWLSGPGGGRFGGDMMFATDGGPSRGVQTTDMTWTGRTDESGVHRLAVDVESVVPIGPASVDLEATVMDVNRQTITGHTTLLVHPSAHYVGLKPAGWVAEPKKPWRVDAIVTDIDGKAVPGRAVAIKAVRVTTVQRAGKIEEETTDVGACDVQSAAEAVPCTLTFDQGGTYRVTADVADDRGRVNRTILTVWVSGADRYPDLSGRQPGVAEESVEVIPDRDEYAPGDTATLLINAPFAPSEALITVRRSGIVSSERRTLTNASTTIEVPIAEGDVPGVTVAVDLVGAAERVAGDPNPAPRIGGGVGAQSAPGAGASSATQPSPALPKRPAYATGAIALPVSKRSRTLNVTAAPAAAQVRPGSAVSVTVAVTDSAGAAVADAQVTLVVVDEAVLALTNHEVGDPIDAFYGARDPGVTVQKGRGYVVLATVQQLRDAASPGAVLSSGDGVANDGIRKITPAPPLPRTGGPDRGALADAGDSYSMEMSSAALKMAAPMDAGGRGGGGPDGDVPTVAERTNLNALAAFVPAARTGPDGRVAVDVRLPDSVTRYRIWAVVTDGAQRFGKGESSLTAQLPLVVRPSAPRFLNFGDAFELPVVVQNPGDADRDVDVVVRAANLAFTGATGVRVNVPAGDRVEVRFPAKAVMAGTAVFQAAALAVDDPTAADAQRVTLPVWTPTTTEAFATYGTIGGRVGGAGGGAGGAGAAGGGDSGAAAQMVARPSGAIPSFGGLSVTASSTALGNLTDAMLYLNTYPYDCTEQIASRLLANVALIDVLDAFHAPGLPSRAEGEARIAADIEALVQRQRGDGGFGYWSATDDRTSVWGSIHAIHALVRARAKKYAVDANAMERALAFVRDIRSHMEPDPFPWSEDAKRAAEAHALSVRAAAGEVDGARAVALFGEAGADAPVDVMGWLLGVIAADASTKGGTAQVEILRRLANAVSETAAGAQFSVGYAEEGANLILASDRRADAVVLDALMTAQPDSDLILKVARGLLESRDRGRWGSTQENAFVLIALDRYFRTYEADTPDFTTRIWLGDGLAGEAAFKGRSADRQQLDVPLAQVPEAQTRLTISKDGPGRLYYRLGLQYAPDPHADCIGPDGVGDDCPPPGPPADSRGFTVERTYEAVDDAGDVRRTADGGWTVKAGARVRVRLTMVAPARRYQVALVDPLPAGFEAENPDLATSASPPPDSGDGDGGSGGGAIPYDAPWRWWGWWWYDHTGYRDDRVEVFASWLEGGVYRYSYIARATTPGTFIAPPTKAEEMYHPETFGRGAPVRVRVEAGK